ncbi:MAG: hypothetical protein J0H55_07380 [Chitinophagaceae bacterium]|nr:hypothetical protein [Chitinophagaceae bacterium]
MNSRLLYRRQFILSSQRFEDLPEWNTITLKRNFKLSVHPDLDFTRVNNNKVSLTLLGYMLDPFSPELNDRGILEELSLNLENFQSLVARTEKYSGRWAIIYEDDSSMKILHDPFIQRSVYYLFRDDLVVCASDPSLIRRFFKLDPDESIELKKFMDSENYRKSENAWIGDNTVFLDVKRLMPNFYLDVLKKGIYRYWPISPLAKLDLTEGVRRCAEILSGSLIAANHRKKLNLAVTSGWDSRLMLAASRPIRNDVTYFISVPDEGFKSTNDFIIPNRLFRKLGLPFYNQDCSGKMTEEFRRRFKENVTMARDDLKKANFIYHYLVEFQDRWLVNGNASELCRVPPHHRPITNRNFTATDLARSYLSYPGFAYVESQIGSWLKGLNGFCHDKGIDLKNHISLYDLLYWEERLGNWAALYPAEQDIAVEQLSPSNNRLLIHLMESVDIRYRSFPNYFLFKKTIEFLWPESLNEPIDPKPLKSSIRKWGRHLILKFSDGY